MRFLTVALLVAACGTEDPAADGLDLMIDGADHVAGAYTRDDATLVFELSRDVDRGVRLIYLETSDGEHLMTDVLAGGVETINILDGRLSISGPQRGTKVSTGDYGALAEMMETPEMKLFPEMRMKLFHHGVDTELSAISF